MLRFREEHMLAGVARRLKRGIDAGDEPFEVFNRCQDHVIAAGRAHVDRVVLEAFLAAVQAAPEELREIGCGICTTCMRWPRSRPTGPGSSSTAGCPGRGRRRSRRW